jgi:hypothetical protein
MAISPLRSFVLRAALWLPAMFFFWFVLSSAVVFPVIRLSAALLQGWMPELFAGMTQNYYEAVFAYTADVSGVPGLPGGKLAVEEQRENVLKYCYGLPLLYGLVMATPLNWRRTFLQLGVGFAVLTLTETFGLVSEVLKTMAIGIAPAIASALQEGYPAVAGLAGATAQAHMQAALAGHGLSPTAIALAAQFGYLVLPAVTPVALWILMNRRFLETLVGWSGEPGPDPAGPIPGTDSEGAGA